MDPWPSAFSSLSPFSCGFTLCLILPRDSGSDIFHLPLTAALTPLPSAGCPGRLTCVDSTGLRPWGPSCPDVWLDLVTGVSRQEKKRGGWVPGSVFLGSFLWGCLWWALSLLSDWRSCFLQGFFLCDFLQVSVTIPLYTLCVQIGQLRHYIILSVPLHRYHCK